MFLTALTVRSSTNCFRSFGRLAIPMSFWFMICIISLSFWPTARLLSSLGSSLSLNSDISASGERSSAWINCSCFTVGSLTSAPLGKRLAILILALESFGGKNLAVLASAPLNSTGAASCIGNPASFLRMLICSLIFALAILL